MNILNAVNNAERARYFDVYNQELVNSMQEYKSHNENYVSKSKPLLESTFYNNERIVYKERINIKVKELPVKLGNVQSSYYPK